MDNNEKHYSNINLNDYNNISKPMELDYPFYTNKQTRYNGEILEETKYKSITINLHTVLTFLLGVVIGIILLVILNNIFIDKKESPKIEENITGAVIEEDITEVVIEEIEDTVIPLDYIRYSMVLPNPLSYKLSDCDFFAYPNWNINNAVFDIGQGDSLTFEKILNEGNFYNFIYDSITVGITSSNYLNQDINKLNKNSVGFIGLSNLKLEMVDVDNNTVILRPNVEQSEVNIDFELFDIKGILFEHTNVECYPVLGGIEKIEIGSEVEIYGMINSSTTSEDCVIYIFDIVGKSEKQW